MIDLMTSSEVAETLRVSKSQFLRTISKAPDFPAPVRLSTQIMRWNRDAIATWLARQERRRA